MVKNLLLHKLQTFKDFESSILEKQLCDTYLNNTF